MSPLLEVRDLTKHFALGHDLLGRARRTLHALDGVSFDVERGETLALVGESGSGKSTLARALLRLIEPTRGAVRVQTGNGPPVDLLATRGARLRALRRELSIVFQDPDSSLNPRLPVRQIVGEGLRAGRRASAAETERVVLETLARVGLPPDAAARYPHEFSGGQRQRIGIARALALGPSLVVCDEPVSALDLSIQAQILNLLADLQDERGLAYLFISHDLSVVRHLAHRVAVLFAGKLVEIGPRDEVFERPAHPYTQALLAAIPGRAALAGVRPAAAPANALAAPGGSALDRPSGCAYRLRCPLADARCAAEEPLLRSLSPSLSAACHAAEPR